MQQNKTGLITTYAKHTRGRVEGFSFWNPADKEDCPLYNPTPLGNTEVKHNDEYAQELKELIERNKRNIIKDMREIVSINPRYRLLIVCMMRLCVLTHIHIKRLQNIIFHMQCCTISSRYHYMDNM